MSTIRQQMTKWGLAYSLIISSRAVARTCATNCVAGFVRTKRAPYACMTRTSIRGLPSSCQVALWMIGRCAEHAEKNKYTGKGKQSSYRVDKDI